MYGRWSSNDISQVQECFLYELPQPLPSLDNAHRNDSSYSDVKTEFAESAVRRWLQPKVCLLHVKNLVELEPDKSPSCLASLAL